MSNPLRHYALIMSMFVIVSAFAPVKNQFTALEIQQISIATPGLFDRSDAFTIDFHNVGSKEYSFPLPVGKSGQVKNNIVDITTTKGDAVKAMFSGVVRMSRNNPDWGNVVVIRHNNGLETVYGRNAQNLVKVGQKVNAGQTIAIVGGEGKEVFCRFAIMINGGWINPEIVVDLHSHNLRRSTLTCRKNGSHVTVHSTSNEQRKETIEEDEDPFKTQSVIHLDLTHLAKSKWAYPLPGAKLISPYGGRRNHSGIDLKTRPNDKIVAAFAGTVTRSGPYHGYGNCITIEHAWGLKTLYSHQSKNLVKVGQKVEAGEVIGLTGRTGRATTEHLHFEVSFNGRRFNPSVMYDISNRSLKKGVLVMSKKSNSVKLNKE